MKTQFFDHERINNLASMPIITLYKHPLDYPDKYVARLWDMDKPTLYCLIADDYNSIRKEIPKSMTRIVRTSYDDNCIIESWM